jgi:hypothetical protein
MRVLRPRITLVKLNRNEVCALIGAARRASSMLRERSPQNARRSFMKSPHALSCTAQLSNKVIVFLATLDFASALRAICARLLASSMQSLMSGSSVLLERQNRPYRTLILSRDGALATRCAAPNCDPEVSRKKFCGAQQKMPRMTAAKALEAP